MVRLRARAGTADSPWRWGLAGAACGLLVTLLLAWPAQWLADRVDAATGGRLQLREARGTLWSGSARLVLTGGPGSSDASTLPTPLHWRLRPALDGLRLELASDCCTPLPLQVRLRPGLGGASVAIGDSRSEWPAAMLRGLGTPWNTLEVDGLLALRTSALALTWSEGRLNVAGQAELQANQLASRLSTLRPIGSYRLDLTGGPVPSLRLATVDGALQLRGSGQWVGTRLRFAGEATAAPEREAALANLLNIIGRRDGARSLITIG